MNVENLRVLAAHLRKPTTADHFNMHDWVTVDDDAADDAFEGELNVTQTFAFCETTGCIAGHAVLLFAPYDGIDTVEERARDFLGLSHAQADALFIPTDAFENWGGITNIDAANVVERLAETGEVVW
jgi:hypothetical protein